MSLKISDNETKLIGGLSVSGSKVEFDDIAQRIEDLTSDYLIKVCEDNTGWIVLFQDPEDKRYWELSYPNNDVHGGGAPMLSEISPANAKLKYNL